MNKPANQELVNHYLSFYQHSKQSVKMRKSSLKYFFNNKNFNYQGHIFDLTTQILKNYFKYLKNLDSVNITTRKNKWRILTSFLEFTKEDYSEKYNFFIVIPKKTINWEGSKNKKAPIKSNKKVYATKEELKRILEYFETRNFKHYLIFRTLIETGMRKGELINAKISELNLEKQYLNTMKGKTGEKYYFFSEELPKLLKMYLNERKGINTNLECLFLTKKFKKYNDKRFNTILKEAYKKINITKRITCHTFRRTINDLRKDMECPNEDRKILLGHKTLDVNVESYTSSDFKKLRNLANKWNPYKDLF